MSEYQYYEFQALDHRLTDQEMQVLRFYSTHAQIPDSDVRQLRCVWNSLADRFRQPTYALFMGEFKLALAAPTI